MSSLTPGLRFFRKVEQHRNRSKPSPLLYRSASCPCLRIFCLLVECTSIVAQRWRAKVQSPTSLYPNPFLIASEGDQFGGEGRRRRIAATCFLVFTMIAAGCTVLLRAFETIRIQYFLADGWQSLVIFVFLSELPSCSSCITDGLFEMFDEIVFNTH